MILDLEEHGGRAVRHSSLLDSSILVLKCDGTILVSEVSRWCRSICWHINFYSATGSCTLLLDWDFSSRHLKWNTCSSPFDDLFKTIAIGRPESRACNNGYCVKQLLYIALNCLFFRVIYTSWHTITIVSFWSVLMQCWQPAEMQKNLEADILPGSISFIWRFLYMDQTTKLLQFYFKQTLQAKQWRSYVKQYVGVCNVATPRALPYKQQTRFSNLSATCRVLPTLDLICFSQHYLLCLFMEPTGENMPPSRYM